MNKGRELRVLIASTDLRKVDVAERTGITPWRLSRIVHGRAQPRPGEVEHITAVIHEMATETAQQP